MSDYKPNSHRFKAEQQSVDEKKKEKTVHQVVNGKTTVKKKNELTKFAELIIAEDLKNVKKHLIFDVFLPSIRNTCWDIITTGAGMLFGVDTRDGRSKTIVNKTQYTQFSNPKLNTRSVDNSRKLRDEGFAYEDIRLTTRGEAEVVLDRMEEIIDTYREVTIADLYELVGVKDEHPDHNYGWTSLRTAKPVRVRDGYALDLPRPRPLD